MPPITTPTHPSRATHPSPVVCTQAEPAQGDPDFRWSHFLSDGTARPVKATLGTFPSVTDVPSAMPLEFTSDSSPAYGFTHDRPAPLQVPAQYQTSCDGIDDYRACPVAAGAAGSGRTTAGWFCLQGACVEAESDPDVPEGYVLAFPAQDDAAFQWLLARSGAAVVAGRADPTLLSVGLVLPPGDTAQVMTAGIEPN